VHKTCEHTVILLLKNIQDKIEITCETKLNSNKGSQC